MGAISSHLRVSSIHIYPVKGCRGIRLDRAQVRHRGLESDRRFMVIDAEGVFMSQREHPRLALLDVAIAGEKLRLGGAMDVPLRPSGPKRRVKIWDDIVDAVVVPDASALLSDHVGVACGLVYMPEETVRPVDAKYATPSDEVSFADAYPVLLASLASLADLNARLEVPVPMDRFRPNLVVEGGEPYEEERFPRAQIGSISFRMPKRCARCDVVLVDQATAAKGKEPLRTLAKYRTENNKVNFAMNLIPENEGVIAVGDAVTYAASIG